MTEELNLLREALRRVKYEAASLADAQVIALEALTQRPATQEVDGPISASLGDIVALWDQHAPPEYMTAIHMQAKRALAGQQPMSPGMASWCAYVGGMAAHWVKSEPDALTRLGDDAFEAAIAGIIERRLWAMPKPTPPATPEDMKVYDGIAAGYFADTQRPAAQTEREAYATARAFALATMAAEEFVRCNGLPTGEADEFMMTGPDLTDEHATACVDHLKWVGECVAFDHDDGVLVRLGDFTLGSLS